MLKKTIKYVDFDGNEREEDFHFNLTKAELIEMDLSEKGGLQKTIQAIVQTKDTPRIFALFKEIILKAYGEKSLDGKRFVKNAEIRDGFEQTEAYSVLLMELLSDPDKAANFINGIIPPTENSNASNIPAPAAHIK